MPDYNTDWKGKTWVVGKDVQSADFPDLEEGDTLTFEGDGTAGTGSVSKHSKRLSTTKLSWATNAKHERTPDTVDIVYRSKDFTITRKPGPPVELSCDKKGFNTGASWTAQEGAGGGGGGGTKPPKPPKPPKNR